MVVIFHREGLHISIQSTQWVFPVSNNRGIVSVNLNHIELILLPSSIPQARNVYVFVSVYLWMSVCVCMRVCWCCIINLFFNKNWLALCMYLALPCVCVFHITCVGCAHVITSSNGKQLIALSENIKPLTILPIDVESLLSSNCHPMNPKNEQL